MSDKSSIELTTTDIASLQEYLKAIEKIRKREPEQLSNEIWDKAWPEIQATGQVPAEYRDRIDVNDVTDRKHHLESDRVIYEDDTQTTKVYYDIVWERWNSELNQVEYKYHDVIVKALRVILARLEDDSDDEKHALVDVRKLLRDEIKKNSLAIIAEKIEDIDIPIDKVNRDIWGLLEYNSKSPKTSQRYNVAKRGSEKPIDIFYSLDFSGLEDVTITRKLEPYDKRVYITVAARFNAGYDTMTIQQIYKDMQHKGRAGASDIKKINESLTKMAQAWLSIDNILEAQIYNYDHLKYDGPLLPMERVQGVINNQIADAAIHVFREPPMVWFARKRKQFTTINAKLFDTQLSKTNANIALEDYLIIEISRIKNGNRDNKMLYETIYENSNIKTQKQKQRAPEKIHKLLTYYVNCGYIKSYKKVNGGVVITY